MNNQLCYLKFYSLGRFPISAVLRDPPGLVRQCFSCPPAGDVCIDAEPYGNKAEFFFLDHLLNCWFTNYPPYLDSSKKLKTEAEHSRLVGGTFGKQANCLQGLSQLGANEELSIHTC